MPKGEELDVVDNGDKIVGSSTIEECLASGALHRAVAVVVVRSDGSIVLQRRSKSDAWQPGMWTLSCTGHVKKGESYAEAAARELKEELGLVSRIRERGRYLIPPITDGELTEREWVALYDSETDSELRIDKAELEAADSFSRADVKSMMGKGKLTGDAEILLTKYFESKTGQP